MHSIMPVEEIYCWCCPGCIEKRTNIDRKTSPVERRHKDIYTKESVRHSPYSSNPLSIPSTRESSSAHRRCQAAKSVDDMCVLCAKTHRKHGPLSWPAEKDHTLPKSPKIGSMPPGIPSWECPDEHPNAVVPVETENDEMGAAPKGEARTAAAGSRKTQPLFVDAFLHNNRLEHMVQLMGYHPHYLQCFLKSQQYILRGDGPLSYDYRHFIAIMAAARHQCSYLVNIQTTEFLLQGGDERWLKGLDHIPKKLRDLYEINKILAHRPWLINKAHIEKLTRGQDNWSLSEVMHAVILLAHFHALSSFVYGCGVNAELDHESGHSFRNPSVNGTATSASEPSSQPNSQPSTPSSASDVEGGIEVLLERMRRLTEETQEEMSQEELQKRFEKVESQSAELPAATNKPSPKADILRFIDDEDFTYQDFAKRGSSSDIPTFRAQDYSWDDHGFSLANRLFPDTGTLLDDKFRMAYNLTYYTMGDNTDVDTSSFRRAIWNYIHCMFGIRHDDYDYSEVNHLLERGLKAYVKTVTCYPERITRRDYDSFMREFKHSEKVHVNLMVLEARLQAELLYALRAIMRYMT